MKRIFSGIQPSGNLHIGNYLGAIKNWVNLQEEYNSVFCIVDLHSLTVQQDPKVLRKRTLEVAAIYLAAGIDPKKSIIFVQSHLTQHTELSWLLNTITKISELERMTQFKEKAKKFKQNINMGLFAYPVLMAADILLYNTDAVPVGEDQRQHVEIARIIARRFNQIYGKVFTVPEALIEKEGARIKGLDDPSKKMSKTSDNPYNYIALNDSPEQIREKIKKAVTDSGKEIKYTSTKPAISNLITIFSLFSGISPLAIEKKYQHKGYAEFKKDLAETIIKGLKDFQKKKKDFERNPQKIQRILAEGARQAESIAKETLEKAKEKMGLLIF